jgi:hypothetical protein
MQLLNSAARALRYESRLKKKISFNLPLDGPDLAPRQIKDTYQLGRPICNPWGQCSCNIILLFSWNSHQRIKGNLEPNLISFLCSSFFLSFHLFFFLFSFYACLWMMEGVSNFLIWDMKNVGVLHGKGMSNVSSNSFQPFKVARINLVHCLNIFIE